MLSVVPLEASEKGGPGGLSCHGSQVGGCGPGREEVLPSPEDGGEDEESVLIDETRSDQGVESPRPASYEPVAAAGSSWRMRTSVAS